MSLKQKKRLLNLFLVIVCVVVVVCVLQPGKLFAIAGLCLCICYGVVHSSIWRCPKCGASLGRGKPKACPRCEAELNYEA